MLSAITEVTRNLVVLIIVAAILELLVPRNDFRPFINMVIGLVLMLTILAPIRMLMKLPAEMEPAMHHNAGMSESEAAARQAMLEQLNFEMTLKRYRELLEGRVEAMLHEDGMALIALTVEIADNPTSLDFGRPRSVDVLAKKRQGEGAVRPVEEVRIGGSTPADQQGVPDRRLSGRIANMLGLADEKVTVRVLNE